MRSAVQTLLISAVLLIVAGCGGVAGVNPVNNPTPATSSVKVKWTSDGNDGQVVDGYKNPLIPVCGSDLKNCKQSLIVVDVTTGESHTIPLPLTTYSYDFINVRLTDVFNAYVTGFDGGGNAIKSPAAVWHE